MNPTPAVAGSTGRLLGWAALVVGSALLIVGVKLVYDLPDDLRYRYSTVVFAGSSPRCSSRSS